MTLRARLLILAAVVGGLLATAACVPGPALGSTRPVVLATPRTETVAGAATGRGAYLVLLVTPRTALQAVATSTRLVPATFAPRYRVPPGDPRRSGLDAVWAGEDAWVAAARAAGRDPVTVPYLTVLTVTPGSAYARAGLVPGERVLAVDGAPASFPRFWTRVVAAPHRSVTLTVRGATGVRRVVVAPVPGRSRRGILADPHAAARSPHRRALLPTREQGPSSGLATGLALLDAMTPGPLAAGRVVAATGELDATGRVWPVGAVAVKARAALAAGADVLLVPWSEAGTARRAVGRAIPVHGVRSLAGAARVLCAAGPRGAACRRAVRSAVPAPSGTPEPLVTPSGRGPAALLDAGASPDR